MHGIERKDLSFSSIAYLNLEFSVIKLLSDIYTTGSSYREATTLLMCCQGTWETKFRRSWSKML